jgi:hypothetical protein
MLRNSFASVLSSKSSNSWHFSILVIRRSPINWWSIHCRWNRDSGIVQVLVWAFVTTYIPCSCDATTAACYCWLEPWFMLERLGRAILQSIDSTWKIQWIEQDSQLRTVVAAGAISRLWTLSLASGHVVDWLAVMVQVESWDGTCAFSDLEERSDKSEPLASQAAPAEWNIELSCRMAGFWIALGQNHIYAVPRAERSLPSTPHLIWI